MVCSCISSRIVYRLYGNKENAISNNYKVKNFITFSTSEVKGASCVTQFLFIFVPKVEIETLLRAEKCLISWGGQIK